MYGNVSCPQCQRSDRVFRVGDLVKQETRVVNHRTSGSETTTTTLQSKRAYQFQQALGRKAGCLAHLLLLPLGLVGIPVMLFGVIAMMAAFASLAMAVLAFFTHDPDTAIFHFRVGGGILVGIVILIGGPIMVVEMVLGKIEDRRQGRWEKLHYCERCDGVFPPGQHKLTPVEQIRSLL